MRDSKIQDGEDVDVLRSPDGLNIQVKIYDLNHDADNATKEGKTNKKEIFIGDVYFDNAIKARVKILNKNETKKDAFSVKGRFKNACCFKNVPL